MTDADKLDAIAQGQAYFADALLAAKSWPTVTFNDRACLNRWLHGTQKGMDHVTLQDIANYKRLYDMGAFHVG